MPPAEQAVASQGEDRHPPPQDRPSGSPRHDTAGGSRSSHTSQGFLSDEDSTCPPPPPAADLRRSHTVPAEISAPKAHRVLGLVGDDYKLADSATSKATKMLGILIDDRAIKGDIKKAKVHQDDAVVKDAGRRPRKRRMRRRSSAPACISVSFAKAQKVLGLMDDDLVLAESAAPKASVVLGINKLKDNLRRTSDGTKSDGDEPDSERDAKAS